MDIMTCLVPTGVARDGMTFGEALQECVDKRVPGIPYVDDDGNIIGRFSVRNSFFRASIPKDLIKGAHLLGDDLEHLEMPQQHIKELLALPIHNMVLEHIVTLRPKSQMITALALMEKFNTAYLFVTDDTQYHGVVTRLGIARQILSREQDEIL
ncbi:MAG: CBS domain-containing protein [Chromatiales bacterium]|jgi:predicted transcriptional regulator